MGESRASVTLTSHLVIWAVSLLLLPAPSVFAETLAATLVRVVDGDTLEVVILGRTGAESERDNPIATPGSIRMVRLLGVDAPESRQIGGTEATLFVREWMENVPDLTVTIESVDRYGRLIAEVFRPEAPDGFSLNAALLAAGHAWWYREYAPDRTDYARLERIARRSRRGLWDDDDVVEPWVWRQQR